ncbi:FecR family protein [Sphingobacterium sp. E70]|nr:FecR family protein [Sphingobacterium sp. E70]ULT23762.1 FecR family protein [Sphingobacterium sp. E70]
MKITREEFRRYTNGQSSATEKAKIERWLHEQEGELEEAPGENHQLRSAWDKLSTNIEDKVKVIDVAVQGKPAIQRLSFIIGLAASLILVLGLGWYIYQQDRSALPIEKQASLKTVRTEAGQRLTLTLSDGSHIVLNGKSELEYPLQFEGHSDSLNFAVKHSSISRMTPISPLLFIQTPRSRRYSVHGSI